MILMCKLFTSSFSHGNVLLKISKENALQIWPWQVVKSCKNKILLPLLLQKSMDQRVVQISRCVEELLTTANELLNAKEEEDAQQVNLSTILFLCAQDVQSKTWRVRILQTSRQPPTSNATRQLMEQVDAVPAAFILCWFKYPLIVLSSQSQLLPWFNYSFYSCC